MRNFIRDLPGRTGATVLLSSHLLSEVEQTATHVGLISKGRLVLQDTLDNLLAAREPAIEFEVDDAPRAAALLSASSGAGAATVEAADGWIRVRLPAGADGRAEAASINAALVDAGLRVFRIAPRAHRLEDVYMANVGTSATGGGDVSATV
jgi:ABC-2 type transport system ATP-binding protein